MHVDIVKLRRVGLLISNMRMQEIAEVLASRIAEYDPDFAKEVFIDDEDL